MKQLLRKLSAASALAAALFYAAFTTATRTGAQACPYSLNGTSTTFDAGAIHGQLTLTSPTTGCSFVTGSSATWLTVDPFFQVFSPSGSTNGIINYRVSTNNSGADRTAQVLINGQPAFTVTQTAQCVRSVTPSSLRFNSEGGPPQSVFVDAPAGCFWRMEPSWAVFGGPVFGTGPTNLTLRIIPFNNSADPRSFDTAIGGIPLAVTQDPLLCSLSVSPAQVRVSVNGGSGTFSVTGSGTDCSFSPFSSPPSWLTITPLSGTPPMSVSYTAAPSPTAFERSGSITYRTGGFAVIQNGNPVRLDASALFFGGYRADGTLDPLSPVSQMAL
ncbi:MAG: hypothetical protein LC753_07675 [Acidobacteria bacterium]|nr:hypothetical protein [Acidobacteriota bacterium]